MIRLASGHYLSPIGATRCTPAASLIETVYEGGMRLPRHSHAFAYLVVMVDGVLRERTGGRTHDLVRGSLVYNDAGESHENEIRHGRSRCVNVELRPALIERLAGEGVRARESVRYAEAGAAIGAVGRLYASVIDPGPEVEVEEALVELLSALWGPAGGRRARAAPWVARVTSALHDADPAQPTLAQLADLAGVQHAHLCRGFRAHVGCTIGQYVRRLRAARALAGVTAERGRGASLAAVALESGYADQPHMTRALRDAFGRSPGRLRRAVAERKLRSR